MPAVKIKLLPCPFCGGKAYGSPTAIICIRCEFCGATIRNGPLGKHRYHSRESIVQAWNRREDIKERARQQPTTAAL